MAGKATNLAFVNATRARFVRPGWAMVGVDDVFKSEWVVESVATRVKDRWIEVSMRLDGEGRLVKSTTDPEELVFRVVYKDEVLSRAQPS